jgi:predicted acylesterase/phospholipase RssA
MDSKVEFDTLVLCGGSINGICLLGALQYLSDKKLISNINTYVGTSVGAIINYLLIIGYSPVEIIVYLCTHHVLFEKLKCFDLVQASRGEGATTFLYIADQIEKMTIDKTGRLFTFKELESTFHKNLVCVTYNVSQDKEELVSHDKTPDLPCLIGLRMSSNMPLVFETFKYGNSFYIDGGLSNNFPLNIGETLGLKVLGIHLQHTSGGEYTNPSVSLIEYVFKLLTIPTVTNELNVIANKKGSTVVISLANGLTRKFFDFNLNSKTKLEMFSSGFELCKNFFSDLNEAYS